VKLASARGPFSWSSGLDRAGRSERVLTQFGFDRYTLLAGTEGLWRKNHVFVFDFLFVLPRGFPAAAPGGYDNSTWWIEITAGLSRYSMTDVVSQSLAWVGGLGGHVLRRGIARLIVIPAYEHVFG
jgi:hypothetical protein